MAPTVNSGLYNVAFQIARSENVVDRLQLAEFAVILRILLILYVCIQRLVFTTVQCLLNSK